LLEESCKMKHIS